MFMPTREVEEEVIWDDMPQDTGDLFMEGVFTCLRIGACLWGLGYLALQGLVVYVLVLSHTQLVLDACGESLWIFLLVHLILPVVLLCMFVCALLCIYMLTVNLMIDAKQFITYYFVVVLLAFIYFVVLCGLGAHFTSRASSNESCRAALISTTGSPLLSTLGWVYVALDGANLLLSMGLMVALGYVHYFLP